MCIRDSFRIPEDRVEPAFLSIITGKDQAIDLRGISGSRRKLLANWIASEDNPLTARVMVNRIWQYHFGRGLVSTTSDFGVNGRGTVYKNLVDWLANAFIESGWSVKSIHRLILTSHAYQQSMNHPRKEAFEKLEDSPHRGLFGWRVESGKNPAPHGLAHQFAGYEDRHL